MKPVIVKRMNFYQKHINCRRSVLRGSDNVAQSFGRSMIYKYTSNMKVNLLISILSSFHHWHKCRSKKKLTKVHISTVLISTAPTITKNGYRDKTRRHREFVWPLFWFCFCFLQIILPSKHNSEGKNYSTSGM